MVSWRLQDFSYLLTSQGQFHPATPLRVPTPRLGLFGSLQLFSSDGPKPLAWTSLRYDHPRHWENETNRTHQIHPATLWQDMTKNLMARSNYALLIAGISEEASDLETAPGNSWVKSMPQWPSKSDNFFKTCFTQFGVWGCSILTHSPIQTHYWRFWLQDWHFRGIDSPEPSNGTLRQASYFSAAFDFDGTFILSIWRVVPVNARGISSPNRFWHSVSDAWTPHVSSLMIYNSLSTTGSEAHLMRFQSHYAKMNCNVVWCQCNVMSNIMWRVHIYIYIHASGGRLVKRS